MDPWAAFRPFQPAPTPEMKPKTNWPAWISAVLGALVFGWAISQWAHSRPSSAKLDAVQADANAIKLDVAVFKASTGAKLDAIEGHQREFGDQLNKLIGSLNVTQSNRRRRASSEP